MPACPALDPEDIVPSISVMTPFAPPFAPPIQFSLNWENWRVKKSGVVRISASAQADYNLWLLILTR